MYGIKQDGGPTMRRWVKGEPGQKMIDEIDVIGTARIGAAPVMAGKSVRILTTAQCSGLLSELNSARNCVML